MDIHGPLVKLSAEDRKFLEGLSALSYCNPFEPIRIELEKSVLGRRHVGEDLSSWSRTEATDRNERANVARITERASRLAESLCGRWKVADSERHELVTQYDDLVTYVLYYRHVAMCDRKLASTWDAFHADRERLLAPLGAEQRTALPESAHLFACLCQVRRAFRHIFDCLIGESTPATRLRSQVWQSIFTHDLRRYRRMLYARMGDLSTLVTGPSGSGKELVARAIGLSQYRVFDPKKRAFEGDSEGDAQDGFVALNLSALSPTLIESELFGHRRGSFTGATEDHAGWLEQCPPHGAVFLDEIGELDPAIQVKLLRVVQTREYSRLGEHRPRRFDGKLLAATNRDLDAEMRAGRFREDLYYRLCSDRIEVPSLSEQLADRSEAIRGLIRFLARRAVGAAVDEQESEELAIEVEAWIASSLPTDYPWPGNIRELEQCVRSVLVRSEYLPAHRPQQARPAWLPLAERGELTADELLNQYCRLVYLRRGGYEPAARVLGLDRRTVKSRVQQATGENG